MESIENIHEHRAAFAKRIVESFSESQIPENQIIKSEDVEALTKMGKINVFSERTVQQIFIDIKKAEDTGFWKGQKVSEDDVKKVKKDAEKLQKKVVTSKDGGSKTVYIQVKNETKPHHEMEHEELMEHHTSQELHDIAENYKKNHEDVKNSVDKNGAADDSFKSQKAEHSRGDVSSSEERYMHIKQAAYKKEKLEKDAADKSVKKTTKTPDDFSDDKK